MFLAIKNTLRKLLTEGYLPCAVLRRSPLILVAYDTDFTRQADTFLTIFSRHSAVKLFILLGWQHETAAMAEPLAQQLQEARSRCPQLDITVLTNSPREEEGLRRLGLDAVFCHQNAFVDPALYPLHPQRRKEFDAIYIARLAPFKRHHLAARIPSLRLIGDYHVRERAYAEEVLASLPQAVHTPFVPAARISGEIARCRCGLCLSAEEGAMFVSAEYLLGGLPVVNTANLGGRDFLFPPFAAKTVPDDPEAVADAVREFCLAPPPAADIRAATLDIMQRHHDCLTRLINACLQQHAPADAPWNGRFPHKLGVRCTRMPWNNWRYGLKIP